MSLSLSVCGMINCLCLSLCKCGQTRPLHNNVSAVQTTGRNKKHGLLISNLALGKQGFIHSGERNASVYDTHIPRPSNSASLQPNFSFVFYIMYVWCLGASVSALCALRFFFFRSCISWKAAFSPCRLTFILVSHMLTMVWINQVTFPLKAECMQVLNWTTLAFRLHSRLSD